jgi:hypothetical protein
MTDEQREIQEALDRQPERMGVTVAKRGADGEYEVVAEREAQPVSERDGQQFASISVLGVEKTGRQCEPFRIPGKMMSSKESAALARRIAQRDGEE